MLGVVNILFAEEPPVSYEDAQKAAHSYARQFWGEVKVGNGIIFVEPADQPTVYMFTIYCGQGVFPNEETITAQVDSARAYRLQGEELIIKGQEKNDPKLIEKGYQIVEEGWKRMRDEEHFGTVFISALHKEHPGVEMYRGLPLNYVSLADVKQIAENEFGAAKSILKRYIFWGLFDFAAEFEYNGNEIFINLQTREIIDTDIPPSEVASERFIPQSPALEAQLPGHIALYKPLEPEPPWEVSLDGVPDYQTIYSRGCAPAAAGCVLGYHDDNYDLLIDGGDKYTAGHRDPNGYGYLHTTWDELGDAMGYVEGVGTSISQIDNGIEAVCNYEVWENEYNFNVTDNGWGSPSSQYSTIRNEISNERPMVYTLCYPTYGGGGGYHSVTLIGYGKLQPPWIEWMTNSGEKNRADVLQKSTDIYEYCYICHDNNSSTGETVYLWWSEFMSSAHMVRVYPGASIVSSMISNANLSCWNYPNPFNPTTEIYYTIDTKAQVVIKIFNITGQIIYSSNEGLKEPGSYSVYWNGSDDSGKLVTGGIYFYQVQAGSLDKVGKMTLLR